MGEIAVDWELVLQIANDALITLNTLQTTSQGLNSDLAKLDNAIKNFPDFKMPDRYQTWLQAILAIADAVDETRGLLQTIAQDAEDLCAIIGL